MRAQIRKLRVISSKPLDASSEPAPGCTVAAPCTSSFRLIVLAIAIAQAAANLVRCAMHRLHRFADDFFWFALFCSAFRTWFAVPKIWFANCDAIPGKLLPAKGHSGTRVRPFRGGGGGGGPKVCTSTVTVLTLYAIWKSFQDRTRSDLSPSFSWRTSCPRHKPSYKSTPSRCSCLTPDRKSAPQQRKTAGNLYSGIGQQSQGGGGGDWD